MKKIILFIMSVIMIVAFSLPAMAKCPTGISPGEVDVNRDVMVFDECGFIPILTEVSQDIVFNLDTDRIYWAEGDDVNALIIRSLISEGSVTGTVLNLSESFDLPFSSDFPDDFYLYDPDEDDDSAEITWSFSGSRKVLSGYFSLVSGDVEEVDSCDIAVMKLENGPRYEIWFGTKGEIEESLYWGSVEDVLTDVNLGPVVVSSDQELVMTLTNWGNETFTLVSEDEDVEGEYILAQINDFSPSSEDKFLYVELDYDYNVYSGFGSVLYDDSAEDEDNWEFSPGFASGDIEFSDPSGVMNLRWLAAEPFVVTEDLELGIFTGVDSSDLAAVGIDVEKVITSSDIDPEDISASFPQTSSTEYISRFEMSVEMSPDYTTIYSGDVVMPTILQLPISFFEGLEEYNDSIFQTIGEQTNTPYPLGDEWDPEAVDRDALMSALRQYLTLTKSWDDGFSEEVRLDGPGFKDAVHMNLILGQYEGNENTSELLLRMAVLLVDSDLQGIETVELNGQTMLVIYDGNRDGVFTDPLDLTASVPENGGGGATTGGSSGGCALGFLTPIAMLLIAPLLVLLKK